MASRKLDTIQDVKEDFQQHERFYCDQGQWFFRTREQRAEGPFSTRLEAEAALNDFLQFRIGLDDIRIRWKIF